MISVVLVVVLICTSGALVPPSNTIDAVSDQTSGTVETVKNNTNIEDFLNSKLTNLSEDGLLDFKGLAKKYIRTAEEYDVVTEDGYVLKIFRIPGKTKNVVLSSHGFWDTSDSFLLRGTNSLIYMLVEQGYDVWAMNYRGNRYSRKHQPLNPDINPLFWDYSLQEFGYYDLPAVIDFILKKTEQKQLSIVGHSEGSAAVFVLTSQRTEYNDKINVFVATAPACYISHGGIGLKALIKAGPVLVDVLTAFGTNEIFGYNTVSQKMLALLCSQGSAGYYACVDGFFSYSNVLGYENLEPDFLRTAIGHYPAGTSRKNFNHYMQMGNSERFAQYDYGALNNAKYGSEKPPLYDFKNVTCKVAVIGARSDQMVSLRDTETTLNSLRNVVDYYIVSDSKFTHYDFTYSRNAHQVLYPRVINILNRYKVNK